MSTLAGKYILYLNELGDVNEAEYKPKKRPGGGVQGQGWTVKKKPSRFARQTKGQSAAARRAAEQSREKYRRAQVGPRSEPYKYGGELPPKGGTSMGSRDIENWRREQERRQQLLHAARKSEVSKFKAERLPGAELRRVGGKTISDLESRQRARAYRAEHAAAPPPPGAHPTGAEGPPTEPENGTQYANPEYDYSQTTAARGIKEFPGKVSSYAKSIEDRAKESSFSRRRELRKGVVSKLAPRTWFGMKKKIPRAAAREMDAIIQDATKKYDKIIKDSNSSPEEVKNAKEEKERVANNIRQAFVDEEQGLNHWRVRSKEELKSYKRAIEKGFSLGKKRARRIGRSAAVREITGVLSRAYSRYKANKEAEKKDAIARRDQERKVLDDQIRALDRDVERNRDTYLADIRYRAMKGEFNESIQYYINEISKSKTIHRGKGTTSEIRAKHGAKVAARNLDKMKRGELPKLKGGYREKTPPYQKRKKDKNYRSDVSRRSIGSKYDKYNRARSFERGYDPSQDVGVEYLRPGEAPTKYKPEKEYKSQELARQRGIKRRIAQQRPKYIPSEKRFDIMSEPYKRKRKQRRDEVAYEHFMNRFEAMGQKPSVPKTMIQRNASNQDPKDKPNMAKTMNPMKERNNDDRRYDYEKPKTSLGHKLKRAAGSVARATGADELAGVPRNIHHNIKHQFVHKFLLR